MYIKNARVFQDGRFINSGIYVKDDRIEAVSPNGYDDIEIDFGGDMAVPGYIDVHTHGYGGTDMMDGADSIRNMARRYAKCGVTAFLPATVTDSVERTNKALSGVREVMCDTRENEAQVLGAHMEGPMLGSKFPGAQPPQYIIDATKENFEKLTKNNADIVRLITVDPAQKDVESLIVYLKKLGITVSLGHTGATAEEVHKAADFGASHMTHLFNGMSGLHHREAGAVGGALSDDRITCELIADLIHVCKDALKIAALCKQGNICLISDSIMAGGMPDGEYTFLSSKVTVKDGIARIPAGNLAGSTLTLDKAVRNMINEVGLMPEFVIPMATSIPARQANLLDRGMIGKGFIADILRLDDDFNVKEVILRGKLI